MPAHFKDISDDEYTAAYPARGRRALALAGSIAAHVVVALAILFLAPKVEPPHSQWVLAYIVELGVNGGASGKGNGGSIEAPPATGAIASAPAKPAEPKGKPRAPQRQAAPQRVVTLRDRAVSPDDEPGHFRPGIDPNPAGGGAGGSASQSNRGDPRGVIGATGSGGGNGAGAGDSAAHAEYGRNPAPAYPMIARRRAQQGTVTLRVLVAADGAVKRVELLQSSGVDSLDDSALETVRTRWRFVPARRDAAAVESWVVVPIRFTLTDVSQN